MSSKVLNNYACCATECAIPLAVLALSEDISLDWVVDATGSLKSDLVTQANELIYEFVDPSDVVLYKLSISGSANAALSGSWTYIAGSKTKVQFDADMLPAITGTGISFVIDAQTQTDYSNGERLVIVLTVRESSVPARSCPDVDVIDSVTV
ncbi:hypothetical protein [uncultured Sphaerochaeta sp.]|uniref:hypothetical protein n=1 Tax=uncultured Sphaerochaeta sp. TaxID=886478 RepID=UPI002616FA36|nr:hypothetical protein [uncultured Sphaerochaeta sp.]